jgi:hypothetical protein
MGASAGVLAFGGTVGVVLLFFAPSALAGGIPAVVMGAPYAGVHTTTSNSWSQTGCSNAAITTFPSFDAATGYGTMADKASASSCGNPTYSYSTASSGFTSTIPVKITHHRASVVVVMSFSASGRTHVSPGSCGKAMNPSYSDCFVSMSISGSAFVYLYDKTSGAYWYSSNYWAGYYNQTYHDVSCYAGNCTTSSDGAGGAFHAAAGIAWWINATLLNPHHHFEIVFSASDYVDSYISSYAMKLTGAEAYGSLNAAGAGNGYDIASITIT